jgi:tetratricopeptide (TPR) repeat protein
VRALGLAWTGIDPSGDRIRTASERTAAALDRTAAAGIVGSLMFRLAVADPKYELRSAVHFAPTAEAFDEQFLRWLKPRRRVLGQELWLASAAGRDQHHGRRFRAAARFTKLALRSPQERTRLLSDAADALELLGQGLLPFSRLVARPIHRRALRARPDDRWVAFRYARTVAAGGRHREALALLDGILDRGPLDPSVEAQCRRRKALSLARLGLPGWESELAAARELFTFEERTLELASLVRAEAVCTWLSGRDTKVALALLDESDRLNPHPPSSARNRAVRRAMSVPLVGRALVKAVVF